tara:strand:+ start:128 stop:637 length:510 start_codon:yes stop_codon:yes gene_type:complete
MKLPYIEPDHDIHLNLLMVLTIIHLLGVTSRGTLKINNERLHIFLYLLKNPVKLNSVLNILGKGNILLDEQRTFSVSSISSNVDSLFDRPALKSLISILIAKELIEVVFKSKNGFFYRATQTGASAIDGLKSEYVLENKLICEKLKKLLTLSEPKLNQALNNIIRKESI